MADEEQQQHAPGGYYSGTLALGIHDASTDSRTGGNKVPTINKFLANLDKDKKGRSNGHAHTTA